MFLQREKKKWSISILESVHVFPALPWSSKLKLNRMLGQSKAFRGKEKGARLYFWLLLSVTEITVLITSAISGFISKKAAVYKDHVPLFKTSI